MKIHRPAALLVALLFVATVAPVAAQIQPKPAAGPEKAPQGDMREQVWWVPVAVPGTAAPFMLETTVYRPVGKGPVPLVLINHGSPPDPAKRRSEPRTRWVEQSRWFMNRGFAVVLPMRRGYARSEGEWGEDYGRCSSPDFVNSGLNTAWDILTVAKYFRGQDFIDGSRVLLVGQSAGGWGVSAASSQKLDGVIGIINFAGGRAKGTCQPNRLVQAMAEWGKQARLPVLWIYTENNKLFGPSLSQRMAEAYKAGGVPMDYRLLPAFGEDGHGLFSKRDGMAIWTPIVGGFLQKIGYGPKT